MCGSPFISVAPVHLRIIDRFPVGLTRFRGHLNSPILGAEVEHGQGREGSLTGWSTDVH